MQALPEGVWMLRVRAVLWASVLSVGLRNNAPDGNREGVSDFPSADGLEVW